jgi:hypothetical protein
MANWGILKYVRDICREGPKMCSLGDMDFAAPEPEIKETNSRLRDIFEMAELDDEAINMLYDRFGDSPLTYHQLAEKYDISLGAACQQIKNSIAILKEAADAC